MVLSQFELGRMMRCQATDEEGFSCLLSPSHEGEHRWDRCGKPDPDGHRCMLPLKHPGRHEGPWYDGASTPGSRHTINYGGTARATGKLADRAALIAARYGWVERSRSFTPGLPWRTAILRPVFGKFTARGRLTLVFECRPSESQNPG